MRMRLLLGSAQNKRSPAHTAFGSPACAVRAEGPVADWPYFGIARGVRVHRLRAMSQGVARFVFVLTAAFFAAFFLWPILQILKGGFVDADGDLTFRYLWALLADPIYRGGLTTSFLLACSAPTLSLLIALPLAVLADRFVFPAKNLLGSLILIPMILPPFVGAIGIKQIFVQYGSLNSLLIATG